MAAKKKIPVRQTPKAVAQALFECGGVTRDAAVKLRMSEQAVRIYVNKYPECKEAREFALDDLREMAQDNLIDMVRQKDRKATFFVLSRFRRGSSWVSTEKEEVTTENEEPLEFEV